MGARKRENVREKRMVDCGKSSIDFDNVAVEASICPRSKEDSLLRLFRVRKFPDSSFFLKTVFVKFSNTWGKVVTLWQNFGMHLNFL